MSIGRNTEEDGKLPSRLADPDRNIELGVLIRDRALALTIGGYFRSLIDRDLLKPLSL
jgi:hypothetical protein